MADGDFKDLNKRTAAEKILPEKAFNISKNPKFDGYQRGLAVKFLIKKHPVEQLKTKIFLITNLQKNYRNKLSETLIIGRYTHL